MELPRIGQHTGINIPTVLDSNDLLSNRFLGPLEEGESKSEGDLREV